MPNGAAMTSASAARETLMDTAERLIGERGLDVSAREIAAQSGHGNNSAVIYHFGNLDGLIQATFDRRMTHLERRRGELLRNLEGRPDRTVADVVEAIVAPALTIPYQQGATHYARFVEQIQTHPVMAQLVPRGESYPTVIALTRLLRNCLPPSDRRKQAHRIHLMTIAMFALMADYERRGELISSRARTRATRELVAVLSAIVTAPL